MDEQKESSRFMDSPMVKPVHAKKFWRKVYVPCPICEKRVCDISPFTPLAAYTADDPNQPVWEPKMAVKCSNPKCGAEILLYPISDPRDSKA